MKMQTDNSLFNSNAQDGLDVDAYTLESISGGVVDGDDIVEINSPNLTLEDFLTPQQRQLWSTFESTGLKLW